LADGNGFAQHVLFQPQAPVGELECRFVARERGGLIVDACNLDAKGIGISL
jgi:hypothetical protein